MAGRFGLKVFVNCLARRVTFRYQYQRNCLEQRGPLPSILGGGEIFSPQRLKLTLPHHYQIFPNGTEKALACQ